MKILQWDITNILATRPNRSIMIACVVLLTLRSAYWQSPSIVFSQSASLSRCTANVTTATPAFR